MSPALNQKMGECEQLAPHNQLTLVDGARQHKKRVHQRERRPRFLTVIFEQRKKIVNLDKIHPPPKKKTRRSPEGG